MALTLDDINEIQRYASISDGRIIEVVQKAIANQDIIVSPYKSPTKIFPGGTNLCPNSDFAWSQLAATRESILPDTVDALNLEVYRVTRQIVGANISTQRLRTVETDAWVPIWERVQGVAEIGGVDGADNYDIAIQFTNNWLLGNKKWYIRVAIATSDTTPLPVGTKLFAGFWVRHQDNSETYAQGGPFVLGSKIYGIHGTQHVQYKVVAKTDGGASLGSQVLDITDAPNTIDGDNYIQITYPGVAGLIEFEVYRKVVATGEVRQIARDRNSSQLVAYDTGQSGRLESSGFPSVDSTSFRAYADVVIDAVSIDLQKTFHNLSIKIPPNFDTSTLAKEGTYLRLGLSGPAAINHQVWLDTVWAAETFNTWTPSSFDDYPSPPSTTMTSGPRVTGTGTSIVPPPIGSGGSCVSTEHDLRLEHGWVKMSEATRGMKVDNGTLNGNVIEDFTDGFAIQYISLKFDCGLIIHASFTHRFIRSFEDGSGVMATEVKLGDELQGGFSGEPKILTVVGRATINVDTEEDWEAVPIRAVRVEEDSPNKYYAVGDAETGWYVYSHNLKGEASDNQFQ